MPETAEKSLPDGDPITSSELVLLNNEASQRQNIPSPLSDTATSLEPQQKKDETTTDPEQLQENLQLLPCEIAQASATKKKKVNMCVCVREKCRAEVI